MKNNKNGTIGKCGIDDGYVESARVYLKVAQCTTIVIKCTLCNEVELTDWSNFKHHLAVQHPVYSRFCDYQDVNQNEEIETEVELEMQNLSKCSSSDLSTNADCESMDEVDSTDNEELEIMNKNGVLVNPKQPFYRMRCTNPKIILFFIDQLRQHKHLWALEYRNIDFKSERLESAKQISQAMAKEFNIKLTPQVVRLSACTMVKWFEKQFSQYLAKPEYKCRYREYFERLQAFVSTDNIGIVDCDECQRTFCTQDQLQRHKFREHCGSFPYVCNVCNMGFSYASKMRTHQIQSHKSPTRWKCTLCEYCATNKWELQEHLGKHSDDQFFECHICGISTKSLSSMNVHRRKHFEDEFQCPYCPKICSVKHLLKSHIKRMHSEKLENKVKGTNKQFLKK